MGLLGMLKKITILYFLSCLIPDKHEKFRDLLEYWPRKDAVGLTMVEKLPVFETTEDSLRVYQITDGETFITAYVRPSDTGGLGKLVRCKLYKGRSRDVMITALTDYGWKDQDTVLNDVTDTEDAWRYSYLMTSCFWNRRDPYRRFDELAELPPPDPLTWLLRAGRDIYMTTASYFKNPGVKATDSRTDDTNTQTTLMMTVKTYVTKTFWPEDAEPDNPNDSVKEDDATRGWFDQLCRTVGHSVPTVWGAGDVTTVGTGQTSEGNTEIGDDESPTGRWHAFNYVMDHVSRGWAAEGGGG
ncbi:uncharacterized protein LOC144864529 [Branchiostoma floridae x Branchiostoma japonicum]